MAESSGALDTLKQAVFQRQEELQNVAQILAKEARSQGWRAAAGKSTTIVLGAFVATQGAAEKLIGGEDSAVVLVIYSLCGLVIASVNGLLAAHRTDTRATELKVLAANCQSTLWQIDSEWAKGVGSGASPEPVEAGRRLLDLQDKVLADTQTKAAQLGVNIVLAVRELWGGEQRATA